MKLNWKSCSMTVGLSVILVAVVVVEIALFISGPSRKYEQSIAQDESLITSKYKNIKDLTRHAFYYTTYVGEQGNRLLWFNEEGKKIVSKKKSSLQIEEATRIAQETYGASDIKVTLGYGYENPTYVIQSDVGSILLDYDTLKEVYFLKEGDA